MRSTSRDPSSPGRVCVMLRLDAEAVSRLVVPEGEPAENLHVTLCCLEEVDRYTDDELQQIALVVEGVAAGYPPLRGVVGGAGRFFPADEGAEDARDVLYACPDVPGLSRLRERISGELQEVGFPSLADHG